MKVSRANGQKVFEGDIKYIRMTPEDNAELWVETYANGVTYKTLLTPKDIEVMKGLFHKIDNGELL